MEHRLENEFLSVRIAAAGAELQSLYSKKEGKEYLWQGDAAWWPRKAPVLFPVVGKLNNNRYTVEGKEYSLPQHGFARDQLFTVAGQTDTTITFLLSASEASKRVYPFDFELRIRYELTVGRLTTVYDVLNTGKGRMLFSIGAHPGFACPLNDTESFSDHFIEFEKEETLERYLLDEGCFNGKTGSLLKNAKILQLNEELFEKDAIVFKNMRSSVLWLRSRRSEYSLRFEFPGFPYFGIWTKPGAPFLCLEPWCGIADHCAHTGELQEKEGIQQLEAGERFVRSFTVEIIPSFSSPSHPVS